MISYLLNKYRRYKCDHPTVHTEEYEILRPDKYTDGRGEYRPMFEGEKNYCDQCGKVWFTDQVGYRMYVGQDGELLEKAKREP